MMKRCKKCGVEKELGEFYNQPYMKDGLLSACKECVRIANRQNYSAKKEYYKEYDKQRHKGKRKESVHERAKR